MTASETLKIACGSNRVGKKRDMYLRHAGSGAKVAYELISFFTEKVEWVSMETDKNGNPVEVRVPHESTVEYSRNLPFTMAGKRYLDLNHFLKKMDGEWGEDVFGRKIFCVTELYPCFDSYDYLNEKRHHRWFFIREKNTISQLFMSDDRKKIYVTEDVQNVAPRVWKSMKEEGFCQPAKDWTGIF